MIPPKLFKLSKELLMSYHQRDTYYYISRRLQELFARKNFEGFHSCSFEQLVPSKGNRPVTHFTAVKRHTSPREGGRATLHHRCLLLGNPFRPSVTLDTHLQDFKRTKVTIEGDPSPTVTPLILSRLVSSTVNSLTGPTDCGF